MPCYGIIQPTSAPLHSTGKQSCKSDVSIGSWLQNARTLGGDRTNYSCKTVLAVNHLNIRLSTKVENDVVPRTDCGNVPGRRPAKLAL